MKIIKIIKKAVRFCVPYGFISIIESGRDEKRGQILEILNRDYASIISDYKKRGGVSEKPVSPYPVWVCWWQGEAAMPEIIKICYSQLLKKSNGHKINLITKDNYKDFISLPEYILDKFNKGLITITHLSDIIRVNLLAKYGGLWIDSTVYTFCDLPDFDAPLFCLRRLRDDVLVSACRWSTYLIYAEKSHLLLDFLSEIFFAYHKKNKRILDYLLFDYFIAVAYENLPEVKNDIDNLPFTNPHIHWLRLNLNNEYNQKTLSYLKSTTQFCKLTYKLKYKEKTEKGLLTYYGHIKEIFDNNTGL
jgi:hypothetical protein